MLNVVKHLKYLKQKRNKAEAKMFDFLEGFIYGKE